MASKTDPEVFAAEHPGADVFSHRDTAGIVLLAVLPRRMTLRVEGGAGAQCIIEVLRQARANGHFTSDDFSALVDMTDFTGVIDWKLVPKISEIMPKGNSRTNKNAYLVRNEAFSMLSKINAVLFPHTEHASFRDRDEALEWLGWR